MTWILSFLGLNYPFLIAAGLFLAYAVWRKDLGLIVGAALLLSASVYVGALRASVETLRGENAILRTAKADVEARIQTQNGYVQAWQAAAVKNAELRTFAERRAATIASAPIRAAAIPASDSKCACAKPREDALRNELNKSLWPE